MRLSELAKTIVAKFKPTMTVTYQDMSVTGPSQDRGFLRALSRGEREPMMVRELERSLDQGGVFLDVGGHLGQYSLVAAQKLKALGAGHIFVFEPNPRTHAYLQQNILTNGFASLVTVENKCVAGEAGWVTLYSDELQSDFSSMIAGADGSSQRHQHRVEAINVDSYFTQREAPRTIKVDVEGAELMALDSMAQILIGKRPKLFIESNSDALRRAGTSSQELYARLRSIYDRIEIIDESRGALVPVTSPDVLVGQCVNLVCHPS